MIVDIEHIREDYRQPNDLDHAYYSGDKYTESLTEKENDGITSTS